LSLEHHSTAPTTGPAAVGISENDFSLLLREGKKAFHKALDARINVTVDEFLVKQPDSPLQLTSLDMIRLSARYCEAVRQGAERLAQELAGAIVNRRRLGPLEREWIELQVGRFISELTPPEAAHDLFSQGVSRYFTIGNPQEAEEALANSLSNLAGSGLLTRTSDEALDLALARHGTLRTPLNDTMIDVPSAFPERRTTATDERRSFISVILDNKGWSILDWAINSGVDYHTAKNYLTGKTNPYKSTRAKLATSLGVEVQKLPT
jgi:hypothetical protein